MPNKQVPITRINKWFSEKDFNIEISMSMESLGDGNFTIILYKVDRQLTEFDNVYGEAPVDGIRFKPPIELKVVPIIDEPNNSTYNDNGSLRYIYDGKFTFSVHQAQLNELDTDINYGDYIGYPITEKEIRYFSVVNDNLKYYDNKHTIMGYKGAFRTIVCAAVTSDEFRGF